MAYRLTASIKVSEHNTSLVFYNMNSSTVISLQYQHYMYIPTRYEQHSTMQQSVQFA